MEILVDLKKKIKSFISQDGIKYFFLYERSDDKKFLEIADFGNLLNKEDLLKFVKRQNGFFRFALWNNCFFFAAVDQVASKNILYKKENKKLYIYFNTPKEKQFNSTALRDILYSGYTLKNETIFTNIKSLLPGECIYLDNNKKKIVHFKWNDFNPKYKANILKKPNFEKLITDLFNNIKLKNLNKKFLIPLSAGFDSRLVVSLMKNIDANFETFTYGFTRQRDFRIADELCKKLEVKNHKIVMNKQNSQIYKQKNFQKFLNYKNYGIAANNFGDFGPLSILSKQLSKNEYMIINGQSGDFLTGGHLPINIISKKNSIEKNKILLFNFILEKHYSLWNNCREDYRANYLNRINNCYFKFSKNYKDLLRAYEIYEFENRQSKWVIGQQKVYDFLGYSWELPLWKTSIMKFFEKNLILKEKINQKYYKSFLISKNYHNIWKNIPINPALTFPLHVKFMRLFFKMIFLFLGKKKWFLFEKKYLEYFLDPTGVIRLIKYRNFTNLELIPRNSISIITQEYFNKFKN